MSDEKPGPDVLDVDGARPAVAWVARLPRGWTTESERLVLFCLAMDSWGGDESAPGAESLAQWTGMWPSTVKAVVKRLAEPTSTRPALLDIRASKGRRRTTYRLLPPGETCSSEPPAYRRTPPNSSPGTVSEPSSNRPVGPDGKPASRPSSNRPVGPDAPFPLPEIPSLSGHRRTVAELLDLSPDDERLQSVERMMQTHGARGAGWLHTCHNKGDLEHLLDAAHSVVIVDRERAAAADRRRCPHGVINGLRAGTCVRCEEEDR